MGPHEESRFPFLEVCATQVGRAGHSLRGREAEGARGSDCTGCKRAAGRPIGAAYRCGGPHIIRGRQMNKYPFFEVERNPERGTAVIWLNRPEKRNAMDWSFWRDLPLLV